MKLKRTVIAVGVAAAALVGVTAGPASAASADPYTACKDGGYVNYKDPLTGKPFANQGRCVSTLARDGQLVPVVAPVNVIIDTTAYGAVRVLVQGQPGTYPVTLIIDGVTVATTNLVIPDTWTQAFAFKYPTTPGPHDVIVTVEDQTFTQTVVVPAPEPSTDTI